MNGQKLAAGGSAGGALAALVVYVLGRFNIALTAEDGAVGASALIAASAFIAHNGILGAVRLIWRGTSEQAPEALPPAL